MGAPAFLLTMLDNDAANRKLDELTTDVSLYQGIDDGDDRMVINGILPEYARPRQRQFWDRRLDDERRE
ncbi:hypothetical protein HCTV-16_gp165 [Haloarcula virus HCTV-16]|nr:hypothetical protein HCTV-16_gp165 [Haloarcula virus HCTV-16]